MNNIVGISIVALKCSAAIFAFGKRKWRQIRYHEMLPACRVDFLSGCELCFMQNSIVIENQLRVGTTLAELVAFLRDNYLKARPEQFVDATGKTLRPGILVLVNDVDSDVVGGMDYALQPGDAVTFISTLHGG